MDGRDHGNISPGGTTRTERYSEPSYSNTSPLMKLPAEIRLQIFEAVFDNCIYKAFDGSLWKLIRNDHNQRQNSRRPYDYSWAPDDDNNLDFLNVDFLGFNSLQGITQTCSKFYREAFFMPFKHYVFVFHQPGDFSRFCDVTTAEQRSHVQKICLCMISIRKHDSGWPLVLTVRRLRLFTGLKALTVQVEYQAHLDRRSGLEEGRISELAAIDPKIRGLMSFRALKLPSVTIHITEGMPTSSPPIGIDSATNQRECLRRVILGPVKRG